MVNQTNKTITTSCAMKTGGSDCVGASACDAVAAEVLGLRRNREDTYRAGQYRGPGEEVHA